MEEEGPDAFSVRKLGAKFGCDPVAVVYHFKSKNGLEQAMADAINAEIAPIDPTVSWRARPTDLAFQYQGLALKYPQTFPLLIRLWITGSADYRHIRADGHGEITFGAMQAGLDLEYSRAIVFFT